MILMAKCRATSYVSGNHDFASEKQLGLNLHKVNVARESHTTACLLVWKSKGKHPVVFHVMVDLRAIV